jgi:ribosomal biogenesis protein LAS1
VHRHLPSLAELKRAAQDSLDWLWEWYWNQLDSTFGNAQVNDDVVGIEEIGVVREKLQGLLKTYVKGRKSEIKARRKELRAAETAISTYGLRFAPSSTTIPSARIQTQLLQMLVGEKMVLPAEKKLRSSMAGAFLIWTPLLVGLATTAPAILPVSSVLDCFFGVMNTPTASRTMVNIELDPVREGMAEWIVYTLSSEDWQSARERSGMSLTEATLIRCFSEPTVWNLKIVEKLLEDESAENGEHWKAILEAARSEHTTSSEQEQKDDDAMDVDIEDIVEGLLVSRGTEDMIVKDEIRGPQKVVGMWRAKPIGWLPEGWESDE